MDRMQGGVDVVVDREKERGGQVRVADLSETTIETEEIGVERVIMQVVGVPHGAL